MFQAGRLKQFLGNWRKLMVLWMVSGCRIEFLDNYEFEVCRVTNYFVKEC